MIQIKGGFGGKVILDNFISEFDNLKSDWKVYKKNCSSNCAPTTSAATVATSSPIYICTNILDIPKFKLYPKINNINFLKCVSNLPDDRFVIFFSSLFKINKLYNESIELLFMTWREILLRMANEISFVIKQKANKNNRKIPIDYEINKLINEINILFCRLDPVGSFKKLMKINVSLLVKFMKKYSSEKLSQWENTQLSKYNLQANRQIANKIKTHNIFNIPKLKQLIEKIIAEAAPSVEILTSEKYMSKIISRISSNKKKFTEIEDKYKILTRNIIKINNNLFHIIPSNF
jgi:hypothetical protein